MRLVLALAMLCSALSAAATQTVALEGNNVAVFNLAGSIRVEAGGGPAVAEVTLGGPDADKLVVDTVFTKVRGERVAAIVIRYPDGDVVYSRDGNRGSSSVKVASDGTFHRSRGERVQISNRGRGTQAWADIVLRVAPGSVVSAYQAVGEIDARGVDAALYLDTHSGKIAGSSINGNIHADTGSGDVVLSDVIAQIVHADTGSGDVELRGVRADKVVVDTGSGDVDVAYEAQAGRLNVDTGSGDVRVGVVSGTGLRVSVDTGSGRITPRLSGMDVRERDGDRYIAERGNKELRVSVDTGSGSVTLQER